MELGRTAVLSAILTGVRLLSGFISNKIFAIYIGPGGFATIGNVGNLVAISSSAAGGLVQGGIVKLVAEVKDEAERDSVVFTALVITAALSLAVALMVFVFREPLAIALLGDIDLVVVCTALSVALPLSGLASTIQSVQNGRREIGAIVVAGVAVTPLILLLLFFLASRFGVVGAATVTTAAGALMLPIVALTVLRSGRWVSAAIRGGRFQATYAWRLGAFALMAATSALCVPASQYLVRMIVASEISITGAGLWQAMWRLSEMHASVFVSVLTFYFLPRYAECSDAASLRLEVSKAFRYIVPAVVASAGLIIVIRDTIIPILFTNEFLALRNALAIQAAGDVAKIASWILAFILIAKTMTAYFVILEIAFSFLFVVLAAVLVPRLGIEGAAWAYLGMYVTYLGTLAALFWRRLSPQRASSAGQQIR